MSELNQGEKIYFIAKEGFDPKELKIDLASLGIMTLETEGQEPKVGAYLNDKQSKVLKEQGFKVNLVTEPKDFLFFDDCDRPSKEEWQDMMGFID